MSTARLIPLLLSLLILSGCGPKMPLIVAHREASHDAPENTLAAFELAWEQGADAIEGDFYLTKDGAIVCHHDKTTAKTAGVDRAVEEQTLEELRQLDVGRWKDPMWEGERIPTLNEVFDTVPPGRSILIEVKSDDRIVPALVETMLASDLGLDRMAVICFDEEVIAAIERLHPEVRTLWLSSFKESDSGGWSPSLEELIATAKRLDADGVDLEANLSVLRQDFVAALHAEGLEVHTWTVNDAKVAHVMREIGVDGITTDRPRWIRTLTRGR